MLWLLIVCVGLHMASAMPPIDVVASVRGKKFEINAETVEEFTAKVEEAAGLEPGQQSVLFRGKVLSADDDLSEIGVSDGDVLNVVKGRKQRSVATPEEIDDGLLDGSDSVPSAEGMGGMGGMGGMMGGMPSAEDLKKLGEDPEQMKEAMAAMDQLLDNNYFEEYFADEDKLEKARQQMLGNLDQYEQMMPGFKEQAKEIASSPEKWKEAMMQAKEQIVTLKKQRDQMRAGGGGCSHK